MNEITKLKLSLAAQGRKASEETREKMRRAHTGKTRSDEHRKAISEGMRRHHQTKGNK